MDRKRATEHAKWCAKHCTSPVTPVGYSLLEIANNRIGAAKVYHSDMFPHEEHDLNQQRDLFVEIVDGVFEKRVDNVYMLRPEQRKAAEIMREFRDYAAGVDWNDIETFSELCQRHDDVSTRMISIMTERENKLTDLRAKRCTLMMKKGLNPSLK